MEQTQNPHQGPQKEWTFMAYLAADNNLSEHGLRDLEEMGKTGATPLAHVAVEIDTLGEFTGSIRYQITEPEREGEANRKVLRRLREKDSGNPLTLANFFNWGRTRFNAVNYLAVIWSHGSGFRGVIKDSKGKDIAFDNYGSSMDMPEVLNALELGGFGPQNHLAIFGLDACLMSMLEIANHFKDHVDILVGSQQTEPYDGWPYDEVLKLFQTPATKEKIARGIVDAYLQYYKHKAVENVTQSAVRVDATDGAMIALNNLGQLLAQFLSDHSDQKHRQMQEIRLRIQSFVNADYVDVIHMAESISSSFSDSEIVTEPADLKTVIVAAAEELKSATEGALIGGINNDGGPAVKNAHGLSAWFPFHSDIYISFRAKYLGLRSIKPDCGWVKFLDTFHGR